MYVPTGRPTRDKLNDSYVFTLLISIRTYNNVRTYRQTFYIIKNIYLLLYLITFIRTYNNVRRNVRMYRQTSIYLKINYSTVPLTKKYKFYMYSSTYNNLHTYAIYMYVSI